MSDIVNKDNIKDVKDLIKEGRLAILAFSPTLLVELMRCKKPILIDMKGVPEDAIILALNYDPRTNMQLLKLVSKEFEPVKEGDVIPLVEDGTVTRIDCTCACKDKTIDDVTTPVNIDSETGETVDVVTRKKIEPDTDMKPIPEEKPE